MRPWYRAPLTRAWLHFSPNTSWETDSPPPEPSQGPAHSTFPCRKGSSSSWPFAGHLLVCPHLLLTEGPTTQPNTPAEASPVLSKGKGSRPSTCWQPFAQCSPEHHWLELPLQHRHAAGFCSICSPQVLFCRAAFLSYSVALQQTMMQTDIHISHINQVTDLPSVWLHLLICQLQIASCSKNNSAWDVADPPLQLHGHYNYLALDPKSSPGHFLSPGNA